MSWKLIFGLSLFGLAMAFGTVYAIGSRVEPWIWLVIFLICAFLIAANAPSRRFLHGFLVGVVNSVWITGAHVALYDAYIARHPREAAMMAGSAMATHPRLMMAGIGAIIGILSGLVLGLLAWIAGKFLSARPARPTA